MSDILVLAFTYDEEDLYIVNMTAELGDNLPEILHKNAIDQFNLYKACKRYYNCDKDIRIKIIHKNKTMGI